MFGTIEDTEAILKIFTIISLLSITYLLSSLDMIVYLLLAYNLSNNHGRKYTQDCLFLLQVFPTLYITCTA